MSKPQAYADANNTWSVQDAKAKLSEVLRRAHEIGPQRLTVHGRESVVVMAIDDYERLREPRTGQSLIDLMANSPLQDVPLKRVRVRVKARMRSVDL